MERSIGWSLVLSLFPLHFGSWRKSNSLSPLPIPPVFSLPPYLPTKLPPSLSSSSSFSLPIPPSPSIPNGRVRVCVYISYRSNPYPSKKVNLSVIIILTYLILLIHFSDAAKTKPTDKEAQPCFKYLREQKLYLTCLFSYNVHL